MGERNAEQPAGRGTAWTAPWRAISLAGNERASRRNPKSAPGFSQCRGSTECIVPLRAGFDAPLIAQRGGGEPGTNLGHEVLEAHHAGLVGKRDAFPHRRR